MLVNTLDALWEAGFATRWDEDVSRLQRSVDSMGQELDAAVSVPGDVGPPPRSGAARLGIEDLVLTITGRQLAAPPAERMRNALRLTFVPCLHLGDYISVEEVGYGRPAQERPNAWRILYEPLERSPIPTRQGAPAPDRTAIGRATPTPQGMELADLPHALEALGDRTRVAILQRLHARGQMFAGQIAEELGVHASTASRHLAQLEAAALVQVRRDGQLKFYTASVDKIIAVAHLLQSQFS